MVKNLVIVESPAKAKTIEGFLGKEYMVKSSFGHVRDLSKNQLGVDIEKGFIPIYEISADKKALLKDLQKLSQGAEIVWLATDEDREGEAISWHLAESLKLEEKKYKRIVFHEITKSAITKAIENPRKIDIDLVNAQQARRVLDRLVGFELSPLLWKKVKPSLSAGRVQSVAVRLIVEREKEIQGFKESGSYKISGIFIAMHNGQPIAVKAELPQRFEKKTDALAFLEKCKNATFTVDSVETKPSRKSPAPPFTTSTLQQEASRKLGFSVARTMMVAQRLYESGKITYMRTDSVNLSDTALEMAKQEIIASFGNEYVKTRVFATKTKGAQEAHEAIRPTYMNAHNISGDESEKRLYELIWKRTIACQMADALLEKTNVLINVSNARERFLATGEVLKFDGFLKVYLESSDDEDDESQEGILPPMMKGQELAMEEVTAVERFTKHLPRYTEASLVKKLEELGIGRPSTYAPTISTIQKREYVVKENREGEVREYDYIRLHKGNIKESRKSETIGAEKNKLFPTDLGVVVNSFLTEYFKDIMDYNFTASVEKEFDEIAQGLKEWSSVIKEFYYPFHKQVENTEKKAEKFSGERLLGKDPVSGRNVYSKIGRFGPMIQIGDADETDKPVFASMRKDQGIETIRLEEALDLFKLPRVVGTFEDKEMVAAAGRFGPYIRHDAKFYSLGKGDDPMTIDQQRAIEVILEKREKDAKKLIKEFAEDASLKILNGRWGPYIASGKENYKIPKGIEPSGMSFADVKNIIAQSGGEGGKKSGSKGKTTTSAKAAVAKKTTKTAKSSVAKKTSSKKETKNASGTLKKK